MFGHDYEAVELVAGLCPVVKEGLKQEFGVGCADEDGFALVGNEGQGVGGGHGWKQHTSGDKSPERGGVWIAGDESPAYLFPTAGSVG